MVSLQLPVWLTSGMVFQQGVQLEINGAAGPFSIVTLEVVKDPTDGRRVSKLDTDYGVILSLETRSDEDGNFHFELPAYRASTDAYTFVFRTSTYLLSFKDLRCGDVWVVLGSQPVSIPVSKTGAPRTPLKSSALNLIRFFKIDDPLPTRTVKHNQNSKNSDEEISWIRVREARRLAHVSAAAFSMAYHLADQICYPVGIVDLSVINAPIYAWLSRLTIEDSERLKTALDERDLYYTEKEIETLVKDMESYQTDKEQTDSKDDQNDEKTTQSLPSEDNEKTIQSQEIEDNENSQPESVPSKVKGGGNIRSVSDELPVKAIKDEHKKKRVIIPQSIMSSQYTQRLLPLKDINLRGIVYAPDINDSELKEIYILCIRLLIKDLSFVFGPKEVTHERVVPSLIIIQISPEYLDPKDPYRYLQFNETLPVIRRKYPMPIGILSNHDLLLPEKAKNFVIGKRLAHLALGLHFTPKMPASCPECVGFEIISNKIMLTFDNTVDGLKLAENDAVLRGFAICGEDRVYLPAQAKILHGVRVMVWSDEVPAPCGVTYGYHPVPHKARFRNRADLPVLPFRFDREESIYSPDLTFCGCDYLELTAKKDWDKPFEKHPVFAVLKGEAEIVRDVLNKTEGASSLKISYNTENSFFDFGPILDYVTLFAPLDLSSFSRIVLDVFNPDQAEKELSIEGFSGKAPIEQKLKWQTLSLECAAHTEMIFEKLRFRVFDTQKSGVLYFDNIRFLKN